MGLGMPWGGTGIRHDLKSGLEPAKRDEGQKVFPEVEEKMVCEGSALERANFETREISK